MRVILLCLGLFSGWREGGVPVCIAPGAQKNPMILPVKGGRFVIIWQDEREGWLKDDIYMQVLDEYGNCLLSEDGVPVIAWDGYQGSFDAVVSEDSEYVYVVWVDCRDTIDASDNGLYMQKMDLEGRRLFGDGGKPVALVKDGNDPSDPHLCISGDGVYVVWEDYREESAGVYMQRITYDGSICWNKEGIPIREKSWLWDVSASFPSDVMVLFTTPKDYREALWVQRVDSLGDFVFGDSGKVVIDYLTGDNYGFNYISSFSDGDGGIYLFFVLVSANPDEDPGYFQHLDKYGNKLLGDTGVYWGNVSTAHTWDIHLAHDDIEKKMFVSFGYTQPSYEWSWEAFIFTQGCGYDGKVVFNEAKKVVQYEGPDSTDITPHPFAVSDLDGGVIVVYSINEGWDTPLKFLRGEYEDIRAVRINGSGERLWGIDVCDEVGSQRVRGVIGDGRGRVIIVFEDTRSEDKDIYASCIDTSGKVVGVREFREEGVEYLSNVMVGDELMLGFGGERDRGVIEIFDVSGRRVFRDELEIRDRKARVRVNNLPVGIYFYRVYFNGDELIKGKLIKIKEER